MTDDEGHSANRIVKQADRFVKQQHVTCPHCGHVNRLPFKFVGRLGFTVSRRCSKCKKLFRVEI